jgi:tetratricopeptide (TPR) repeat protein
MTRSRLSALVLCTALLLVACKGDKQATPGVVITPLGEGSGAVGISGTPAAAGFALTPQPGLNVDMATARKFESEGDIESAAAAYVSIAASKSDASHAATLAAGRLLLDLDRPEDVRLLLEQFLKRDDLAGEDLAAHYLLARAYAALEMWPESLQQYDAYIASARPATPYAYLDRSAVLLELEQTSEAVTSVQTGLSYGVPDSQRRAFLLRIAEASERAGALGAAINSYRALVNDGLSGDVTLALSRIVALKRLQGDATYSDELTQLLVGYPSSAEALDNLEEALQLGDPVAATVRGLVYYRHNDYTKAEPEFQEQIALAPNAAESAEAYYYLAAIQESKDEIESALANYATATALNPRALSQTMRCGGGLAS